MLSRRKKTQAPVKRKWAVSDSDSDDDKRKGKKSDSDDGDMSCTVCKSDPDIYCLDCKVYMCLEDFTARHKKLEGPSKEEGEESEKSESDKEEEKKDDDKDSVAEEPAQKKAAREPKVRSNVHKFRMLVGVENYRLDTLAYGWDHTKPEPQHIIFGRKKAAEQVKETARAVANAANAAAEAIIRQEEEAVLAAAALEKKKLRDAEYEKTQLEAEQRNKRDLGRNILPKSLGGFGRR